MKFTMPHHRSRWRHQTQSYGRWRHHIYKHGRWRHHIHRYRRRHQIYRYMWRHHIYRHGRWRHRSKDIGDVIKSTHLEGDVVRSTDIGDVITSTHMESDVIKSTNMESEVIRPTDTDDVIRTMATRNTSYDVQVPTKHDQAATCRYIITSSDNIQRLQ